MVENTKEQLEKIACVENFNKKREEYVRQCGQASLDSFLTLDYSLGYADVFPLTDSLEKILTIKDEDAKINALRARYNYPSYPNVNAKSERDFIILNHNGSKFLTENPNWIQTYAGISNFIDELIDNKILIIGNSVNKDGKVSKAQIIESALPYVVSTFINSTSAADRVLDTKNFIQWLAKFSNYSNEFAQLRDTLKDEDYSGLAKNALAATSSNSVPEM